MSILKVIKAPETMTAKKRVLNTFAHEKTDRVAIDFSSNPVILAKLEECLGITQGDAYSRREGVRDALGVDSRLYSPRYIGPELFKAPEGRAVDPLEGCLMRHIENASGAYWDFCDFPLKDAEDEQFEAFPVPDPDNFDYAGLRERVRNVEYAVCIGGDGTPDIINSNGRIMGMEDVLCHLIGEDEAAMDFINRRANYQLKMMERSLEACKGYIDFVRLGEDLGTQHSPMISLQLYRKVFKPIHKRFVDLAKAYGLPVMVHTCGSSSWVYEDFIEMGVDAVDTLQPEATNMSPSYLKATFGNRLAYSGCISTAGPLAYGTPDDVEKTCKETLEIMMKGGGYFFAPTHAVQDNTPPENVVRMYNSAHKYGRYE